MCVSVSDLSTTAVNLYLCLSCVLINLLKMTLDCLKYLCFFFAVSDYFSVTSGQ